MIQIENDEVMGWEHAIRGTRNPMNSWAKSDSKFLSCAEMKDCSECFYVDPDNDGSDGLTTICHAPDGTKNVIMVGSKDWNLMMKLRNAGTDHRKFMRMIVVYADITAPLYWWKEFDTYKVGTVANSCSTMHKIADKEFTLDDFSHEHLLDDGYITHNDHGYLSPIFCLKEQIYTLNMFREMYLKTKDKKWWWQMIQLLPSSYNQKRTVMLNYEVLANIYKSRKGHRLDEWHKFREWIETLPCSDLITEADNDE